MNSNQSVYILMILSVSIILSFGEQHRGVDGAWKDGRATFYGHEYWTWSIHEGSCGFGYLCPEEGTGWDVAAISVSHSEFERSCGRCYEVQCRPSYPSYDSAGNLEVNLSQGSCRETETSLVVTVTDWCLCSSAQSIYSNERWCCDDVPHFDLSIWAFEKIADTKQGVIGLSYREVPCGYIPNKRAQPLDNPHPPNPVPPKYFCPKSNFPLRQQIIISNSNINSSEFQISGKDLQQKQTQEILYGLQEEYDEKNEKISNDYKNTFSVLFGILQKNSSLDLQQKQQSLVQNDNLAQIQNSSLNFEYFNSEKNNIQENDFISSSFQKFNDQSNYYQFQNNLSLNLQQMQAQQQLMHAYQQPKFFNLSDAIQIQPIANLKNFNEIQYFLQNLNINQSFYNHTNLNNQIFFNTVQNQISSNTLQNQNNKNNFANTDFQQQDHSNFSVDTQQLEKLLPKENNFIPQNLQMNNIMINSDAKDYAYAYNAQNAPNVLNAPNALNAYEYSTFSQNQISQNTTIQQIFDQDDLINNRPSFSQKNTSDFFHLFPYVSYQNNDIKVNTSFSNFTYIQNTNLTIFDQNYFIPLIPQQNDDKSHQYISQQNNNNSTYIIQQYSQLPQNQSTQYYHNNKNDTFQIFQLKNNNSFFIIQPTHQVQQNQQLNYKQYDDILNNNSNTAKNIQQYNNDSSFVIQSPQNSSIQEVFQPLYNNNNNNINKLQIFEQQNNNSYLTFSPHHQERPFQNQSTQEIIQTQYYQYNDDNNNNKSIVLQNQFFGQKALNHQHDNKQQQQQQDIYQQQQFVIFNSSINPQIQPNSQKINLQQNNLEYNKDQKQFQEVDDSSYQVYAFKYANGVYFDDIQRQFNEAVQKQEQYDDDQDQYIDYETLEDTFVNVWQNLQEFRNSTDLYLSQYHVENQTAYEEDQVMKSKKGLAENNQDVDYSSVEETLGKVWGVQKYLTENA